MKTLLIITIITIINFINFFPVLAITKTPTPSPTLALTPTPTRPEDEKVQDIRQAIKEKVTQIKDQMDKRAFVGLIKDIAGETIILSNFRGQQRLNTDGTTAYIASNKKEITINDLAIGDKVIAFGILTNTNEIQTIRINVIDTSKVTAIPVRNVAIGKIIQTDSVKSTVSFANEGTDASTKIYKINKSSKLSSALNQPLTTINLKKMDLNLRTVLVYQEINKVLTVKSLFNLK